MIKNREQENTHIYTSCHILLGKRRELFFFHFSRKDEDWEKNKARESEPNTGSLRVEHTIRGGCTIHMEKSRVIQEYVPGKQVTLAHLIAHPDKDICKKVGLSTEITQAIGILTITPGEAAIIAADVAAKSGEIEIGFLDRFSGTLVISGDVSSVESSLKSVVDFLKATLDFSTAELTRS